MSRLLSRTLPFCARPNIPMVGIFVGGEWGLSYSKPVGEVGLAGDSIVESGLKRPFPTGVSLMSSLSSVSNF